MSVRTVGWLICLIAGACSAPYVLSPPPLSRDPLVTGAIQRTFAEAKLRGTPQVTPLRAAHAVSPGDWLMCLRSSDPADRSRYAIYFTANKFVRSQLAVVVDRCDEESYLPFIDPALLQAPAPAPTSK